MTTSFLQGEVAALSHGRKGKASHHMETIHKGRDKSAFKKGFKNKQRPDRKPDRFSLLTKTPKEIFALEKGKFKAPPPMAGKLSQFIKELKQNDKTKAPKKGEMSGKDKPWERVAKPRITQSFSPETAMSFPPLSEEDGTESPMIIEVEMGGHFVHRVYVDGGASSEVLYEHCFVKLRKEIRDQMVPATTHLIGFSGETIWPLGQIALLVKIGDETHSTSAWMNFMVIRSPSQHNAIIGRPGIRKIRAVPSTAHGMLKFPVEGGTVTLKSSRVIPLECAMISGPSIQPPTAKQVLEEKIKIAIHPEYPEQTVAIGSTLTEKGRKELCALLKQNLDIFAWKPADMTGVPRNIATPLNIQEDIHQSAKRKGDRQPDKKNKQSKRSRKVMDAGIMKESIITLLSNPFELEGYDIQYRPRTAIKGQILADFIVERPEEESPDELMAEPEVLPEPWTLFTDGSSCVDGSGAAGLDGSQNMGIKNLQANVDSRLVANQVNGSYIAKESGMVQYLNKVKTLARSFKEFSIKQIPRSENKKADALSKIASTSFAHLNKQVLVEELKEKSINEEEILDRGEGRRIHG
ncbi:reverse transcriptase domain-containing protein [Tanacetum coccineum]